MDHDFKDSGDRNSHLGMVVGALVVIIVLAAILFLTGIISLPTDGTTINLGQPGSPVPTVPTAPPQ